MFALKLDRKMQKHSDQQSPIVAMVYKEMPDSNTRPDGSVTTGNSSSR